MSKYPPIVVSNLDVLDQLTDELVRVSGQSVEMRILKSSAGAWLEIHYTLEQKIRIYRTGKPQDAVPELLRIIVAVKAARERLAREWADGA